MLMYIYFIDPNGKMNTLVLTYGNGTTCDLSKEPRQSEVILGCGERDHLVDVTETRTCHYQVKVMLTSLCQFEGFAKKTKKVQKQKNNKTNLLLKDYCNVDYNAIIYVLTLCILCFVCSMRLYCSHPMPLGPTKTTNTHKMRSK